MNDTTTKKSDIARSTGYLIISYLLSIINQLHSIEIYRTIFPTAVSVLSIILSLVACIARYYENGKKVSFVLIVLILPIIIINLLSIN